ncbi:MAG: hypothetical protein HY553_21255 [Elusimicrobia bacterium]|nr:hypothetical protein [Elusimicrobiota bacterium]
MRLAMLLGALLAGAAQDPREDAAREMLREAYAFQLKEDPTAAANLGKDAAWMVPEDVEMRTQAAYLRFMNGQAEGALEEARLAVAVGKPAPAELALVFALAFYGIGEPAKGLAALKKAAKADPRYRRLLKRSKGDPIGFHEEMMLELTRRFNPEFEPGLKKRFAAARAARTKP